MAQFRTFEDMRVWHEARALKQAVRAVCRRHPMCRDFSLVDQITRSARSIGANIAEGCDALTPPEFITYLGHAKRSASETRSHLYDALDEKYITLEELKTLSSKTRIIASMLAKLIHHLQSLDQKQKRTLKDMTLINQETNKPIIKPSNVPYSPFV